MEAGTVGINIRAVCDGEAVETGLFIPSAAQSPDSKVHELFVPASQLGGFDKETFVGVPTQAAAEVGRALGVCLLLLIHARADDEQWSIAICSEMAAIPSSLGVGLTFESAAAARAIGFATNHAVFIQWWQVARWATTFLARIEGARGSR